MISKTINDWVPEETETQLVSMDFDSSVYIQQTCAYVRKKKKNYKKMTYFPKFQLQ